MANLNLGYKYGLRNIQVLPVKASTTISAGDMVDFDSNRYLQPCGAGDIPIGVAVGQVPADAQAATDGALSIAVDTSQDSVYRYVPDAGNVTIALVGKSCDVGGAQSIDIDASTDDCILVRAVNVAENTLDVSLILKPTGVI